MKYIVKYKIFESKITDNFLKLIKTQLKFDSKWEDVSNKIPEMGFDAVNAFSYRYDDKYTLMLLFRKHKELINEMLYLYSKDRNTMNFIDRLDSPYYYDNITRKTLPLLWCVDRGKILWKNFKEIDKLPKEEELKIALQELIDDGLMITDIKYGQTNKKFPVDEYDKEVFLDRNDSGNPIKCVVFMEGKINNDVYEDFNFCQSRLELNYDVDCVINVLSDSGVVIEIYNR